MACARRGLVQAPVQPARWSWSCRSAALGGRRSLSSASDAAPAPSEASIRAKLEAELNPVHLHVEDTSGGCGAFFSIRVVSEEFQGKATLARHRLVKKLLAEEIADIHGLTLETLTPAQYKPAGSS